MPKSIFLVLRIIVAVILVQTLRYKFTAHPDSVYIFSKLGMEPVGRLTTGIVELIAAILILIPKTIWLGAAISLGIISGAIVMHLTILGIEVHNDGGKLFLMALLVFCLSLLALWFARKSIPIIGKSL